MTLPVLYICRKTLFFAKMTQGVCEGQFPRSQALWYKLFLCRPVCTVCCAGRWTFNSLSGVLQPLTGCIPGLSHVYQYITSFSVSAEVKRPHSMMLPPEGGWCVQQQQCQVSISHSALNDRGLGLIGPHHLPSLCLLTIWKLVSRLSCSRWTSLIFWRPLRPLQNSCISVCILYGVITV